MNAAIMGEGIKVAVLGGPGFRAACGLNKPARAMRLRGDGNGKFLYPVLKIKKKSYKMKLWMRPFTC